MYVIEQAEQVQPDDFVIVLDTPAYQKAFNTPALAADAPLVRARLGKDDQLISLALTGQARSARTQRLHARQFLRPDALPREPVRSGVEPVRHPTHARRLRPLRQALHEQWEQTLAGKNSP